jgi:hypothetical protein
MNLNDIIPAGAIEALSSQLGIPADQARKGAEALLPSLIGGFGDAAGGHAAPAASDLESHLLGLGGESLADNVVGPQPTDIGLGNQILGKIFGSKDTSRQVADHASQSSGLDPALLKKMLPILAMLVAGYMSKQSGGQQGGLAGILTGVLGTLAGGGQRPTSAAPASGGLGGILGSILGGR